MTQKSPPVRFNPTPVPPVLLLYNGAEFRVAAAHNPPPAFAELGRRQPKIRSSGVLARVAVTKQLHADCEHREGKRSGDWFERFGRLSRSFDGSVAAVVMMIARAMTLEKAMPRSVSVLRASASSAWRGVAFCDGRRVHPLLLGRPAKKTSRERSLCQEWLQEW